MKLFMTPGTVRQAELAPVAEQRARRMTRNSGLMRLEATCHHLAALLSWTSPPAHD